MKPQKPGPLSRPVFPNPVFRHATGLPGERMLFVIIHVIGKALGQTAAPNQTGMSLHGGRPVAGIAKNFRQRFLFRLQRQEQIPHPVLVGVPAGHQ